MTVATAETVFEEHGPVSADVEDLLRWTAASGDFSPIHFDPAVAAARGFPGPLVHGPWKAAVLRQLVAGWLGEGARIEMLSTRYLRPDIVGHALWFGGSVVSTECSADGATRIECELWVRNADGEISVAGECIARVEPDAEGTLPLDRLKAAVRLGEVAGVFTYRVEENDVEAFVSAIGAQASAEGIAPPTYFAALDPVERRDLQLDAFLEDLPFEKTGGGNAFNEVEYQRPIKIGDVLTVSTRYSEVYEKAGSRGTLLFRVRVNEIRDPEGVLGSDEPMRTCPQLPPPEGGEVSARALTGTAVGDALPTRVHTTTTAQLVRYAGAARDFSGIHYDSSYARERGFPDVIVHGFLKAGFLAELAREWGGEGSWFRTFGARYQGIDVVGAPIVCRGIVTGVDHASGQVELKLWTENAAGSTTTTAVGLLQMGEPA